jgi:allophanate hydrolase subunit 2
MAVSTIQAPFPGTFYRGAVPGGGYFMIGTVISADTDLTGQLQPHQPARFKAVDMTRAMEASKANELQLKKAAAHWLDVKWSSVRP